MRRILRDNFKTIEKQNYQERFKLRRIILLNFADYSCITPISIVFYLYSTGYYGSISE